MREEKVLTEATVSFLEREGDILLAKKTKKIGMGCWNGYGGGIEKGETAEDAAVRELFEETNGVVARPEDLKKIAIVFFKNTKSDGRIFICKVHFYIVKKWKGEPKETEEMTNPTWFNKQKLPFHEMMPSDKEWLPIALSGKKIIAEASLGPFQQKLLGEVKIKYVKEF